MLVEVAPIIRQVARQHHVRAEQLRSGEAPDARREAARALREAGLSLREVGRLLDCDHTTAQRWCRGVAAGDGQAGKVCSRCRQLKPLDAYTFKRESADARQSHCLACARKADRAYRHRIRHRRANGEERCNTHVRLHADVHALVKDTAERHRVTMATIVERAVVRSLACTNCHRALRTQGSDLCPACARVWGVAS